jgi:hypothetical protein
MKPKALNCIPWKFQQQYQENFNKNLSFNRKTENLLVCAWCTRDPYTGNQGLKGHFSRKSGVSSYVSMEFQKENQRFACVARDHQHANQGLQCTYT